MVPDREIFFEKTDFLRCFIPGPRTRTSRAPNPLFGGAESFVDDYFTGDIFSAFEEADQYENALLMFYAPWDADCTRAKEILEVVAKTFVDNDIYFAAVNCWEGQCNTEFNTSGGGGGGKPSKNPRLSQHQYPIFIFYPKDRRGIQYNGPISVQVKFVRLKGSDISFQVDDFFFSKFQFRSDLRFS